jgi:CRISPR/Cas system-associated exonuclease Cas4 (RecB family)
MSHYSNSYLEKYRECPLACLYRYELRLRKREEGIESHHMAYSRAFHEGLRRLYLDSTLREAQDAFLEHYPRQLDIGDLAKTRQNGITVLVEYARRWSEENKRYRVIEVEQLDHAEDGFVVKLDLVWQHKETEQIFPCDHKVTGKYLNYDYWRQFEPNSQIVEYVRYVKEKFGFCDGFIIDAVSMRHLQRASKNGPAGFWCNFERQTFNVNERQMEADLDSRRYWIDRIEHSKESGRWGMNTKSCYFCEYRDLCKAGWFYPEDQELIEISYRQVCGRWFRPSEEEPLVPCALDLDHGGEHALTIPDEAQVEFEIEV